MRVALAIGLALLQQYTIRSNSDLVLLDVSVRNPSGGYVTGLSRDSFHVFEDGKPRPIAQFSTTDTAVTVGLVLDNSGSMHSKRRDVILAGLAFASDSNKHDQFFVVNFNDRVAYGLPPNLPFTDQIDELHRALSFAQPAGQTALYDAIASSLGHLQLSTDEFRTLIVVSDGGDNVSHVRLAELLRLVESSQATIYTVGLMDPEDRDLNPGVLRKLANISGGEYFQPATPAEVIPVLRKISKDIRNRYVVAYVPDETTDRRKVRAVRVKVAEDGRKLIARSRTSYAITPPPKEIVATASPSDVSHH